MSALPVPFPAESTPEQEFVKAIEAAGLPPPFEVIADGAQFRRDIAAKAMKA